MQHIFPFASGTFIKSLYLHLLATSRQTLSSFISNIKANINYQNIRADFIEDE